MSSTAPAAVNGAAADAQRVRWWVWIALMPLLPMWATGFFGRELWTPDEPREFDVAFNMLSTGDLVTPRLAGEPFLEKPPLAYWMQSASMTLLGPSAAAARLPNLLWAMLAALCVAVLAADFAPQRRGAQTAIMGALSFATMFLIVQTQMWLATDAPLIALTAASLLSIWRLLHATSPAPQLGWAFALGTSLAGVFLAKNGFGLLVPGLTLIVWLAWERRLRSLLRWPLLLAFAWFGLCVGVWLVALLRQPDGAAHLNVLLWDNLVARFLPVESNAGYDLGHRSSHWRFLLSLPVYVLPWTFAWWAAGRWSVRTLRSQTSQLRSAVRFGIAATLPACLLLLLSRTARGIYFGPALIGGSLLVAVWLATPAEQLTTAEQRVHRWIRRTLQVFAGLCAFIAFALIPIVGMTLGTGLLLIVLAAWTIAASVLCRHMLEPLQRSMAAAAGAFLVALLCLEAIAFPTIDRMEDLNSLVSRAAPRLRTGQIALYCGDETTRAVLDYRAGLRFPNVCSVDAARELLALYPHQQFFVQLARPSTRTRLNELFPSGPSGDEPSRSPSGANANALGELGLTPIAQWAVPGGRAYALYGASTRPTGGAVSGPQVLASAHRPAG